jgi:hypothetical protein
MGKHWLALRNCLRQTVLHEPIARKAEPFATRELSDRRTGGAGQRATLTRTADVPVGTWR